jgi:hypothetical protein
VLGLALAGHALGGDWKSVRSAFEYVDYALLATVVVGIVYLRVRRRGGRSAPDAGPAGDETSPAAADASTAGTDASTADVG